jgi:hypothetical protein
MEIDDGVSLLDRAIVLEPDPQRRAELWHAVGRASILKFDGERFWTAMQAALEGMSDRSSSADAYADLAFQTSLRAGMWKRRPDPVLVQGWIERALDLAEPGTAARAKALFARVNEDPENAEAAEESLAIADELDDIELTSFAFDAVAVVAMARGDYDGSYEWARRGSTSCHSSPIPTTSRWSTASVWARTRRRAGWMRSAGSPRCTTT